jgi:two-component system, NtrC family, response regulator AtoC
MGDFRIFVVDDDDWYRELLCYNLSLNPDYSIRKFADAASLLVQLHEKPDIITLDYRLPDSDGKTLLERIREESPETDVVVISEQEDIQTAVDLLKSGAYDYIVKSRDIRDRLLHTVANIRKQSELRKRVEVLQEELGRKYSVSGTLIGASDAIRRVFGAIEKAAATNISIILTGETGTGKELAARAIHYNSKRKNGPFVAVNMAAVPRELAESELFGHEKGAYTGAVSQRIGRFEQATGGTLFLDEIGDMEPALQAKLLRVLQEKELTRVGGHKLIRTDCRILVATNRDLLQEVKAGRFREDLYYRLFGFVIEMPPLRERDQDILLLARHFIRDFCRENDLPEPALSSDAQKKLLKYHYPGNVRELKAIAELAAVMSGGELIGEDHVQLVRKDESYQPETSGMTLNDHIMHIVRLYLQKHGNNIKEAARELDISYTTIYRYLKKEKDSTAPKED